MGYGDLAAHGNPLIHTPQMDRIHHESVRIHEFLRESVLRADTGDIDVGKA